MGVLASPPSVTPESPFYHPHATNSFLCLPEAGVFKLFHHSGGHQPPSDLLPHSRAVASARLEGAVTTGWFTMVSRQMVSCRDGTGHCSPVKAINSVLGSVILLPKKKGKVLMRQGGAPALRWHCWPPPSLVQDKLKELTNIVQEGFRINFQECEVINIFSSS